MNDLPVLLVKVSKKLKTLTFTYGKEKGVFAIHDDELNLLEIDQWISDILFKEYEKANLRKKLLGK